MKKTLLILLTALILFPVSAAKKSKEVKDGYPGTQNMPAYSSDYTPIHGEKLPVIKITSETKKNDFVTTPKAQMVVENGLTWGWITPEDLEKGYITDPYYENCTITVEDDKGNETLTEVEAQVKVRGNWTTNYDKKPLRIKFNNKQSMLGLHNGKEYKNWVLLASYKDWSFLRDATTLYFSKLISPNYSSDIRLVEVQINGKNWGVYLLAEQQEVKGGRIDITENEKKYKGTDIGYLLEYDGYAVYEEEKDMLTIDYAQDIKNYKLKDINGRTIWEYKPTYTIKSDINDMEQKLFIEKYMNNLWKLCYEAAYNNVFYQFNEDFDLELIDDPKMTANECVSRVIDIPSLVNTYIINEVACDPDLYWSSFYMDIDFGANGDKKLRFEAPWDFDSAYGAKRHCANAKGVFAGASAMDVDYMHDGCGNPWLMVFINCDWFKKLISEKWKTIKNQKIINKLVENIDYVINNQNYQNSFYADNKKWRNIGNADLYGTELNSDYSSSRSQRAAAEYLKDWLQRRFKELDKVWK